MELDKVKASKKSNGFERVLLEWKIKFKCLVSDNKIID